MSHQQSPSTQEQLWNPARGIRFSPSPKLKQLYPRLNMSRFRHASDSSLSDSAESGAVSSDPRSPSGFVKSIPEVSTIIKASNLLPENGTHEAPATPPKEVKDGCAGKTEEDATPAVLPPSTSLDFNVSDELFHAARRSIPGTPESYWSYTMYQSVDANGSTQKVKVHYCTSKHTMETVCQKHFQGEGVIGFDLEWLPYSTRNSGARENVSLIQLATPGRIGLFHVALFPKDDFVAPTFRQIMEDDSVSKVGVHIQGDCTRLRKFLGVNSRGVFELSHLHKLVAYSKLGRPELINKVPVALSTQVKEWLRLPLYKGESVRASNWMKPLQTKQIIYSASDAYAGLQLYHVLEAERQKLDPVPPRPHHAELGLPIRLVEPTAIGNSADESSEASESEVSFEGPRELQPVKRRSPSPSQNPPSVDARIVAAESKMMEYRASKQGGSSARPSALRAYYIWNTNEDLKPESIARLLREPPLQTNTVLTYILDTIVTEQLPYDVKRMREEVLAIAHPNMMKVAKYQSLIVACQSGDDAEQSHLR